MSGPFFSWKYKLKFYTFLHINKDQVQKFIDLCSRREISSFCFLNEVCREIIRKSSKQDLPPGNPPGYKRSPHLQSGRAAQNGQRWSGRSEPGRAKSS